MCYSALGRKRCAHVVNEIAELRDECAGTISEQACMKAVPEATCLSYTCRCASIGMKGACTGYVLARNRMDAM